MDLRIDCRNIAMAPRWKTSVEQYMEKLQKGFTDVTHARVTLEKNLHHKKGRVATVQVVLSVRGATMTANKTEKTFEEAIKASFLAIGRELKAYRGKQKSTEVRLPPAPLTGVIESLNRTKGHGFILIEGGDRVYFHRNALHGMDFDELEDGTRVSFNVEQGDKGPQATTVNRLPRLPRSATRTPE
jgi:cold shock CspA family protein/ribosome-associated translation inhibitor RaiA